MSTINFVRSFSTFCDKCFVTWHYYSAAVGERCIAINPSVSLWVCMSVCLSVHEDIYGTAGPFFAKLCVQIPRGYGSVLLWRRCHTGAESDVWR